MSLVLVDTSVFSLVFKKDSRAELICQRFGGQALAPLVHDGR